MNTYPEYTLDFSKSYSFLDFPKSVNERYYLGFASITFRTEESPIRPIIAYGPYVLNSKGDGWFRKCEGIVDGYGLAINSIKRTSRKTYTVGDFNAHKVVIEYTTYDEKECTDKFWLYIHKDFNYDDVMKYIDENKDNWYP